MERNELSRPREGARIPRRQCTNSNRRDWSGETETPNNIEAIKNNQASLHNETVAYWRTVVDQDLVEVENRKYGAG